MSSTKLYVGSIPEGAKDKDLSELFQAFGDVEEAVCLRGYGFVHFAKSEDANAALNALDDSEFMGSHIQVQLARTKGHGYGRGSGPPRPRDSRDGRRGPPPRSGYRDGGSSYKDRRYGGGSYESGREYDRYSSGGKYSGSSDYYDRPSSNYDRSYERSYDRSSYDRSYDKGYDRYDRYQDYDYARYSDYRARSRSPPREYYRDRGYERDPYRESRRW